MNAVCENAAIESDDIELLHTQMMLRMSELNATGLDNVSSERFCSEIEMLQSKINALKSSPIPQPPTISTNQIQNVINQHKLTDLTLLPIYDSNVATLETSRISATSA